MRRILAAFALAGGILTAAALAWRSRRRQRERVDLYFDDGSVISLGASRPEAARLLPLARRVLASARE